MTRKPRVMIVDDSAVVRRYVGALIEQHGFEVAAAVSDPLFAIEHLRRDRPDAILLDVEMPRMDGISFLKHLMETTPLPVVMCSTLTEAGADTTLAALAAGAVAIVTKPRQGLKEFVSVDGNGIVQALRAACRANVAAIGPARAAAPRLAAAPMPVRPAAGGIGFATTERVVVVGVSTGGVQAIERVLPRLPRNAPGMVIVQHMPEKFTATLASRLDELCEVTVREARDGDRVLPGMVLIAPGGRHTRLARSGAQYRVEVFDGPAVNHHRPSVDVLFKSAAACVGRNAVGLIMTGMGDDGARGMRDLHATGAHTIAQDEASCVVYGMPREAVRLGGVDEVCALDDIATRLLAAAARPARAPA